MALDTVARRYQTVWDDFVVQSHHLYHTELEIDTKDFWQISKIMKGLDKKAYDLAKGFENNYNN